MRIIIIALFACVSFAIGLDYQVKTEGGPLTLPEEVSAAFVKWQALDEELDINETQEASSIFRYGDSSRFGPDALSLTIQRQKDGRTISVVLPPENVLRDAALLHEVGILLGLPPNQEGVMNPAISELQSLSTVETAALALIRAFPKEDINRDGSVDFYDLVALARAYGQSDVVLPSDINEDGLVDEKDLEQLRKAYTFSEPSLEPPVTEDTEALDDLEEFEPGGEPVDEEPIDEEPIDEEPVPPGDEQEQGTVGEEAVDDQAEGVEEAPGEQAPSGEGPEEPDKDETP